MNKKLILFLLLSLSLYSKEVKTFYPDGKIKSHIIYNGSEQNQTIKHYDNNGTLKQEDNYVNNKRDGEQKVYYPNGKIHLLYFFKNGIKTHVKEFDKNGTLQQEDNYVNNKRDGEQKVYYPNGKIHLLYLYKNGVLVKTKEYYDNGKLKKEILNTDKIEAKTVK